MQVEDPQNPAVTRTIMTRVTVPERLPPAREAILIPGPAVSRPTSKWLQRVQAVLSKGRQQEVKLPFEATGRTPANQGTERLGRPLLTRLARHTGRTPANQVTCYFSACRCSEGVLF